MTERRGYLRLPRAILLLALAFMGPAEAQQYTFHPYGLAQGLNNLGIKGLHQDDQGFLWVSTENGIFRYDGERFESFGSDDGIPSSSAVAFGEAPDGSLLAGGEIGLFHKAGKRFEPVSIPGAKSVSWFSGIQSDGKGSTWIATDAGLMVMTGGSRPSGFAFRLVAKPVGVEKTIPTVFLSRTAWSGTAAILSCAYSKGDRLLSSG